MRQTISYISEEWSQCGSNSQWVRDAHKGLMVTQYLVSVWVCWFFLLFLSFPPLFSFFVVSLLPSESFSNLHAELTNWNQKSLKHRLALCFPLPKLPSGGSIYTVQVWMRFQKGLVVLLKWLHRLFCFSFVLYRKIANPPRVCSSSLTGCANLTSLDSLSPQEKKRQGYIHELIETEERYVEDLQIVLEVIQTYQSNESTCTVT